MNPKPEGEGIIALRAHPKIRLRGDPFRVSLHRAEPSSHRVFSRIIARVSRVSTSNQTEAITEKRQRKNLPRIPNSGSGSFSKYSSVISDTFDYGTRAL